MNENFVITDPDESILKSGIPVVVSRLFPTRTIVYVGFDGDISSERVYPLGRLVVFSLACLRMMIAGVVWHDEPGHCPTWVGGVDGTCSCDVVDAEVTP